MDLWFTEDYHDGWELSVRVNEVLVTETSPYQRIDILQTRDFGRMLVLDGKVQACELDEFIYHEMMAHVTLLTHPNPRRVLVAGGGDGGAMREVMRHPSVERGVLVDIDERVIQLCNQFMPTLSEGLAREPRLVTAPADAAEYLRKARDLDVILVDSSDPVGPSEALFQMDFYRSLKNALAPGGMVCLQAGSPFFYRDQIVTMVRQLREVFPVVRLGIIPVPTYPSGNWCLAFASLETDPGSIDAGLLERRQRERGFTTRYYTPQMHHAAMVLPPFLSERLEPVPV
ncbi:MAG: polyamine aminopropyltransferase [Vulcanimicrobiota bacterium]